MVIVASCRTVDVIVGSCRIVDVNYPDSQSQQKKPCLNYSKLIDNNRGEISSLLTLDMNTLSWRAITMTNVDFTI
jgi:hypothetical protein